MVRLLKDGHERPDRPQPCAIDLRYLRQPPDALLEILHDIQEHKGFVPQADLPVIAKALNLSRADVHGVMSFYHDFEPPRQEP